MNLTINQEMTKEVSSVSKVTLTAKVKENKEFTVQKLSIIIPKRRDTFNDSKFLKKLQSKSLESDNKRCETSHHYNSNSTSKTRKHTRVGVVTGRARRKWKEQQDNKQNKQQY
jgi:hypothetical protein